MNLETINDRTDHNRLAEQFIQRIREETETPIDAKPRAKRTRKPAESPAPAVAETIIPAAPPQAASGGLQIFNCDQNSPEWRMARMGIPTASSFADVIAKGEGKTRRTYLLKLAGEILTGEPMENVITAAMERGHALEAEARDLYTFQTGAKLHRVGFIRNNGVGCSPDSLIGEDGGLEIKTKAPHLFIDMVLKDEFPPEHKAQVQGTLWITGRQWWDLAVYWPGLPLFVKRVHRDEPYILMLGATVDKFIEELEAVVAQMRDRIEPPPAVKVAA